MESNYSIRVLSGKKFGASHALPFGEVSVGTTLDSEFFIGCSDTWHQLLRADASADLRSASPSKDVAAEMLMRIVIKRTPNGIDLRVDNGFAEVNGRRYLTGEHCVVAAGKPIQVGSSKLEIQALNEKSQDDTRALQRANVTQAAKRPAGFAAVPTMLSQSAAVACFTLLVVTILSYSLIVKGSRQKGIVAVIADSSSVHLQAVNAINTGAENEYNNDDQDSAALRNGFIHDEAVVAIVGSQPSFLMTNKGTRYYLGATVDNGYRISNIENSTVQFQRGSDVQSMSF